MINIKFFSFLIAVSFFSLNSFSQKKFPAPASADAIANPLKGNTAATTAGKIIYTQYCVTCHGTKGKGDGIAAPGLPKPPADHSSDFVQKQTDGAIYWIVTNGNNPMPSYKTTLTSNQRWQVINYIRTLAKGYKKPTTIAKVAEPKAIAKTPTVAVTKPVTPAPVEKQIKPVADTTTVVASEQKQIEPVADTAIASVKNKTEIAIEPLKTEDSIPVNPVSSSPAQGKNNFAIFGNAEMTFMSSKGSAEFGEVNFKPIFLWRISDKLFVEAEPEFETGEGTLNIGLEYANMCFIVNKYITLHAGRFLPKFGAYRGRMGEGFINRFATAPVGFGDGGIGAMNEVGFGAQGGFGAGDAKINYELYISNGPILLTDPESAGQFEYEAYIGNNKSKAVGGRLGILPLTNSSLELGFSFQNKMKTGDAGTPYENVGLHMQAIDLNYYSHINPIKSDVRLIGEWKHQKVDNATYYKEDSSTFTFNNSPSTYYVTGTIRPSHVHNTFVHNLELAARYSEFKRPVDAPWGGGDTHQFAISLDYWLKWNSLVKFTYQTEKDEPKTFYAQVVFGF